MLRRIKVRPLAEESLGVRSMCTYIETPDVKVLLDAGASLAPRRHGHPPHPKEYQAMAECREQIRKAAEKADVVTVSHYHYDHYTPSYTDWFTHWSTAKIAEKIYKGKQLFVKSYRSIVNSSQKRRGWIFKKTVEAYAKRLEAADHRMFEFGDTILKFSNPVFHGADDSPLGWLVMLTIKTEDETAVFASDVQGPMLRSTQEMLVAENPQLVIIGGPPSYLADLKVPTKHIEHGIQNLIRLVEKVPTVVLGHHILRDEKWREVCTPVFTQASKKGHEVLTAAEFLGKKNNILEYKRPQLFREEPPNQEFEKWIRLAEPERKSIKPPL